MDHAILEFLIIPGSLTVLVLPCLYFVSCPMIKIQINLRTTQHSQSLQFVTWIRGYCSSLNLTQDLLDILSQVEVIIKKEPEKSFVIQHAFLLNFSWKWQMMTLVVGVCYGTYVSCFGLFSVKIEFFDPAGFSVDKQFDLVLRTRCVKVNYKCSK